MKIFYHNKSTYVQSPERDIELFLYHFYLSAMRQRVIPTREKLFSQDSKLFSQYSISFRQESKLLPRVSRLLSQYMKSFPQSHALMPMCRQFLYISYLAYLEETS